MSISHICPQTPIMELLVKEDWSLWCTCTGVSGVDRSLRSRRFLPLKVGGRCELVQRFLILHLVPFLQTRRLLFQNSSPKVKKPPGSAVPSANPLLSSIGSFPPEELIPWTDLVPL